MKKILFVVAVLTSVFMVGCNKSQEKGISKGKERELSAAEKKWLTIMEDVDKDSLTFPLPEMRTIQEIEAEGKKLVAQDVLNALESLCFVELRWPLYVNSAEVEQEFYSSASTDFTKISPVKVHVAPEDETITLPFYYLENDAYTVMVCFDIGVMGITDSQAERYTFSKEDFEKLMEKMSIRKFEITEEYLESIKPEYGVWLGEWVGKQAYEGIVMTEELLGGLSDRDVLEILMSNVEDWMKEKKEFFYQTFEMMEE